MQKMNTHPCPSFVEKSRMQSQVEMCNLEGLFWLIISFFANSAEWIENKDKICPEIHKTPFSSLNKNRPNKLKV